MLPIVATLLSQGLSLAANAVLAKGKEWIEEKAGVKLPEDGKEIPPADLIKIKQVEVDHEEELLRLRLEDNKLDLEFAKLEAENMQDVNTTMQAESKSEHWAQYTWRPFNGFCFGTLAVLSGLVVLIAYVGVMFFEVKVEVLTYLPSMLGSIALVMGTITPILGIASWYRGKMKLQQGEQ